MREYRFENMFDLMNTLERLSRKGTVAEKRFVWAVLNTNPVSQRIAFADVYQESDAILAYLQDIFLGCKDMGISPSKWFGVLYDLIRDEFESAQTPLCTIDDVREVLETIDNELPEYREVFQNGSLRILLLDGQSKFRDIESNAYIEKGHLEAEIRLYGLRKKLTCKAFGSRLLLHEMKNGIIKFIY